MGTVALRIRQVGCIVLLSAVWFLAAHGAGWEVATLPNALAFGLVTYLCFRSAR